MKFTKPLTRMGKVNTKFVLENEKTVYIFEKNPKILIQNNYQFVGWNTFVFIFIANIFIDFYNIFQL